MADRAQAGPVLVLQHAQSETLGLIEESLRSAAKRFECVRTFAGQSIPDNPGSYSALIVMGGPMSVYETDRYPFLGKEMHLIEGFVKMRLPILGVCLGSQLLAACLGARVQKGQQREIGWHTVELSGEGKRDRLLQDAPSHFTPFHWHGDIFELPDGATRLASSDITPVQAYRYDDRAYGILFHLEVTEKQIREMLSELADEIRQENISAEKIMEQAKHHLGSLQGTGATVFTRWAALI
jgi:GMP synthase (glutamine-hydrolysing)